MTEQGIFGLTSEQIAQKLIQEAEKRFAEAKEKHSTEDTLVLMQLRSGALIDTICQIILDNNTQITLDVHSYIQHVCGFDPDSGTWHFGNKSSVATDGNE